MTHPTTTCVRCAGSVQGSDRFCESCGAPLFRIHSVALPLPRNAEEPDEPGGDRPDRDQTALAGIVMISDRGIDHLGNEDAAAAGIVASVDGRLPAAMAAAVCDGVSTSDNAVGAAIAASTAGVDAMLAALAASRSPHSAVVSGLANAAKAAASVRITQSTPSCTYTAAAIAPAAPGAVQVTIGNVGDSRAYWISGDHASDRQLTVDDSVAQELIAAGIPADSDAVQAGAHTLTRWLGADAGPKPWSDSGVLTITIDGPGILVLCTDGLWNYLPDPQSIAQFCTAAEPLDTARALVDHAVASGGQDNITVVVIPIGGVHEFG